nr:MAG: hypothetical protein EDM05_30210 [Leptolyngbya sp. IPPAS B-1204]
MEIIMTQNLHQNNLSPYLVAIATTLKTQMGINDAPYFKGMSDGALMGWIMETIRQALSI